MTNLSNRVLVYSVSTDAFFNEEETKISQVLMDLRLAKTELEKVNDKTKNTKKITDTFAKLVEIFNTNEVEVNIADMQDVFAKIDKLVESLGTKLKLEIGKKIIKSDANKPKQEQIIPRSLRRDHLITYSKMRNKEVNKTNNVVALFESSLTRTLNLSNTEVNDEIIIVKAYHYNVLEDLILNGFKYGDDKEYVFFSASSGQMKKKKCVFIRKDKWDNHKGTFLCGLTWDRINATQFKKGGKVESGININKFLAYLSLLNTATTKMTNFDINQVVVVPDLEMNVKGMLQFIDHKTYIMDKPEMKSVPMNVSDGVGMCLPSVSKKSFQIRANWTKGLIVPFDYVAFAKKEGKYTITDVWGDTHHIIKDNVKIILSASQMKTWKYYKNMDELRTFFIDNKCEAGKTNEEVETKDIHLNYQYLQSLTNMVKSDLVKIAETTNNDIEQIGSNLDVMLRSIGATKENVKKDALQSSIYIYNNLLNDPYVKEMIKSKKAAMVKEGKAGSLRIEEGKRMFIIPDLYGYCEFLFKGDKNPKGLLGDGKVFGNKIPSGKVNVMRSPALSREHGVRDSIKNDTLEKWFITGGLVISNHDLIGRLLQADFDGDQVNVCWHSLFVEKCEEAMQNIYPLYYNMATAPIQKIDEKSIYTSLISSFGGSIGIISNQITKIWNSAGKFTEEKLNAIKLLCMYNNYMIDACKTNYLPKPPTHIKKAIKEFTNDKTPYFFQFAKGKKATEVANKSLVSVKRVNGEKGIYFVVSKKKHTPVVNMLSDIITKKNISFKSVADKMDYKMLMSVNKIKSKGKLVDDIIKETYDTINKSKKWMLDKESDDYKENKYTYIAKVIKDEIMEMVHYVDEKVTDGYVANVLVEYLYKTKDASNKKTLWESFGDILFANLKFNLEGLRDCGCCGDEFKPDSHKDKYCSEDCKTKMNSRLTNNNSKKARSKK
ncbi:hypothetical protein [Bacillus sp. ISL-46]|uniref:hypothetical protein n=1 Tax=Bacillus sp. ISL-46 TaxID=2819129 RepID=UPI001BE66011|nr:hypothetical protein [Bacillus sp. ISL-46]MBT2723064.1 hypothetical protein [Bacillus sp. ISL-46]